MLVCESAGAGLELVNESCPLCSSTEAGVWVTHPQMLWVRCDCGLIYKRVALSELPVERIYQQQYFTGGVYDARTRRRIAKSRNQILDVLNHAKPGPLLDVGCSLGYTLLAGQSLGLEATGVDVSEYAVEACRAQKLVAERAVMDRLPFADHSFGLVTIKHTLEHTPTPRLALREVRRVLSERGGLFIAVPDARYGKALRNPQASRFYAPDAGGLEHYVYYTPATLGRLLQQEGFRVVRVNPALVHRQAPMSSRLLQSALAPLRAAAQWSADRLQLRKEFWLTAVRAD